MKHSMVCRALALVLTLTLVGNAWSDGDGKSPEQLGTVSFVTSCEPAVQAQFTQSGCAAAFILVQRRRKRV